MESIKKILIHVFLGVPKVLFAGHSLSWMPLVLAMQLKVLNCDASAKVITQLSNMDKTLIWPLFVFAWQQ